MTDSIRRELQERAVSCCMAGPDTLEASHLRWAEDATRLTQDNSPRSVCRTRDCVLTLDAGCWRRTSHRMTMTCCTL